jgi:hypothetical protein
MDDFIDYQSVVALIVSRFSGKKLGPLLALHLPDPARILKIDTKKGIS